MHFVPPPRRLAAVTFDLDGLMFNTEDLYEEVGRELLARRQCTFTRELKDRMMGRKADIALQLMIDWHQLDATPADLAAESAEIFRELLPARLQPMPGLLPLLAALEAADIPKGIATSSDRAFVTTVLGLFDLGPRFDFVLASEDVRHGKPAPDVYRMAAQRHGVETSCMMVLEDSVVGCQAACAAVTYVVAVPTDHSRQHDFPPVALRAHSLQDERIYAALEIASPLAG
jgi:HAD superfamily hydrolase (TIGR01509 family)